MTDSINRLLLNLFSFLHLAGLPMVFGFNLLLEQPGAIAQTVPLQIAQSTMTNRSILRTGGQNNQADVIQLQALLRLLGYYNGPVDGVYEASTAAAVSAFQQAAGIFADGIAGQDTWNRLLPPATGTGNLPGGNPPSNPPVVNNPAPANPPVSDDFPVLRFGSEGSAVSRLQERLQALEFYFDVADGVFGPGTEAAVKAAQEYYGLEPDGIVGDATWDVLF